MQVGIDLVNNPVDTDSVLSEGGRWDHTWVFQAEFQTLTHSAGHFVKTVNHFRDKTVLFRIFYKYEDTGFILFISGLFSSPLRACLLLCTYSKRLQNKLHQMTPSSELSVARGGLWTQTTAGFQF